MTFLHTDPDGRKAVEAFIADYEKSATSLGEKAAAAAMRVLVFNGKPLENIADDAFRCEHVLQAFRGMLIRTAENRKALTSMFANIFDKKTQDA